MTGKLKLYVGLLVLGLVVLLLSPLWARAPYVGT